MRAFYKSNPTRIGYRKRMLAAWLADNPDRTIDEQRLAGQRLKIEQGGFLSPEELDLIKRQVTGDVNQVDDEDPNPEIEAATVIEANELPKSNENSELLQLILANVVPMESRERLPTLKGTDKTKLNEILEKVNLEISKLNFASLTAVNDIAYACARTVTEAMGLKIGKRPPPRIPAWKERIQRKIEKLRRNLSQVESWKTGSLRNEEVKKRLESAYHIKEKGLDVVTEHLKQRVVAMAAKLQRFDRRHVQYRQNRQFQYNQKRLYADLQGEEQSQPPNSGESVSFWTTMWGSNVKHRRDAKWIEQVKKDTANTPEQTPIHITTDLVTQATRRIKNWKAPGPDQLQGFWLKKLQSLHAPMAQLYQKSLTEGCPAWMTKGRTVLLQKDKAKGTAVGNYRPITCLPTMWKLLSGMISDEIRSHLSSNGLLPLEQKGCVPKCRGTKDLLLTDKAIVKNCKRRKVNLEMMWIDYKKAYDRVPHSWLIECMEIYKVNPLLKDFLANEMRKWTTELTSCGEVLGEVHIRRGIFQGDALSPLLFVMAMIPISSVLNRMKKGYVMEGGQRMISHLMYMDDIKLYSKTEAGMKSMANTLKTISEDIGMEFGLEKCAKISMKHGKVIEGGDLPLFDGVNIRELDEDEGYKYLGILQNDLAQKEDAKATVKREYFRRTRLILKTELNAGNTIRAINTWALPVMRYTAGILEWTVAELQEADRKTRKLLTMNGAFNQHGDVDRLYIDRQHGGKGLLSVEQVIREDECGLKEYVDLKQTEDSLLRCVANEGVISATETKSEYRQRMGSKRKNWKNKIMHGQFLRQTEDQIDQKESVRWIAEGYMKKATESLLMAAQEQALRTRKIRHAIDKANVDPKCRWCGAKDETVNHLIAGCSKLAQGEYKARHDKVATVIHWRLCKKYGIDVHRDWYKHEIQPVIENDKVKILWDMCVQTDKVIQARRPDIVVVDKLKKQVSIIDIAVPADKNVAEKEKEKITKYQDLKMEVKRLWKQKRVRVIPVVVGALGSIPKGLQHWLTELGLEDVDCGLLQKCALFGTARILRRTLVL